MVQFRPRIYHPPMKTPVAIFVRVSTTKQSTERQITSLQRQAKAKGWDVVEVIEETVSGVADVRPGIDRLLELAQSGAIKKVMVHEISRIARRNSVAHKLIEELCDLEVSLYWHAQAIETLLPNGKRNPAASLMFTLLAELARSERDDLRERILSGLEQAKANGKVLGRPKGSSELRTAFLAKYKDVARLLRQGQSVRNAAKISGRSPTTVAKVKKFLKPAA